MTRQFKKLNTSIPVIPGSYINVIVHSRMPSMRGWRRLKKLKFWFSFDKDPLVNEREVNDVSELVAG